MISTMTVAARESVNERADQLDLGAAQIDQLFIIADAIALQAPLRRALSDPGLEPAAREELSRRLLADKLDAAVIDVVAAAAAQAWPDEYQFASAVLDQAVRAALRSHDDPSVVARQLFTFGQLVNRNPQLKESLRDGRIELTHRRDLVAQLMSQQADRLAVELARRSVNDLGGRANSVESLIKHFLEVGAQAHGRTLAQALTAQPMSQAQCEQLQQQLERIYGTRIFLVTDVDPQVLGGVRVEVGDEVIDGTVRARLEQVHHELKMGD